MFLLENQKQKVIEQLTTCDPKYINQHINILVKSDFLVDSFYHHPDWLIEISNNQPNEFEDQNYQKWLNTELESISNEERLMTVLRQFRRKILTRINWSQIVNSCSTENTLKQLSTLAEVLIISARDFLYKLSCQDWGTPCNTQGVAQPLLILGMGKLGGFELNFSSDIDLIFTYPENGTTKGGRRELDNSIFFTRLGQRLIKALNQVTQDGFVYRVDMRLRPLGDGGPLVLSFTSFEDYYQEQGRDWERYAMVKAKILGDQNDPFTKELYQILKPFVYRRYIDFSVLQSLRNMKGMIEREVRRRGLHDNIKLGAGGIREIEFIVQVFQLIRGGRIHSLQTRSLLKALIVIESEHMLNQQEVMLLRDNYLFLRRCENLLQGINDEQTQTLPNDELNQIRLALGMGFENWSQFYQALMQRMLETRKIFNQLIGYDESEEAIPPSQQNNDSSYDDLWLSDLSYEEVKQILPNLSDSSSLSLFEQINQFRKDISKRTIGVRGREILDRLMPKIFALSCESESAISTMPRVLKLLVNIVSRTTYLELLLEYPNALKQLIHLCDSSIMISEQLARHPLLLDELINFNSLYKMIEIDQYQSELYQYLLRIDPNDEEQQIEALRQFKQMQLLRISASDIMGILPTMKVSDHLTYLAEAMLEFVLQMSWNQMVNRYGKPDHLNGNDKGIISIGYGKLGGLELGYASDLDLVFLHDCPENGMTTGNKVIDSRQFYLRLVQRIIHLFSVRTNSGILYEIDLRLRPQGNSGLLACSLHSFEEYQMNEAWTWEHQALVRTRVVAGDFTLQSRFLQIRNQILMHKREQEELKKEIREMRQKMRTHLSNHDRDKFDIKIDEGGIGDIEFISQYLVLNYANSHPKIAIWSDNVRIFEMAARLGILPSDDAETLIKIYIAMRNEMHRLSLQNSSNKVSSEIFKEERKLILQIWLKLLA